MYTNFMKISIGQAVALLVGVHEVNLHVYRETT